MVKFFYVFVFLGSDFPAIEVQHHISHQDCCGAREPIRTAKDVRWIKKSQQELPFAHHQGNLPFCYLSLAVSAVSLSHQLIL